MAIMPRRSDKPSERRQHRERAGRDDPGERQPLAHAGEARALVIIGHQFGAPRGIGNLHRGEAEIENRQPQQEV